MQFFIAFSSLIYFCCVRKVDTVDPLYKYIRYNSKIHHNVNLVCTKNSRSCIFSLIFHVILQENMHFVYFALLGHSNKYTKHMIFIEKTVKKYPLLVLQVSL